jgi:hypothetical protein
MTGFEENYFLSVKDDSIVYNELETRWEKEILRKLNLLFYSRVRLSKRRPAGGGVKAANLRLIQRYRAFSELEEKTQVRLNKKLILVFIFTFLEKTIESS